jgi:hypothetical protein
VKPRPLTPDAIVQKCYDDPLFFMEMCLFIAPKEGGLVRFILNDEQVAFLKAIWTAWQAGMPVRFILLKARQRGFSTLVEAFLYWLVSHREHMNALVISHELDSAHHILQMTHRFAQFDYRRKIDAFPDQAKSNRNEIVFDNPDWRSRGEDPGLDSRMIVDSAENKSAGHSYTFQAFHGSEVARWSSPELLVGVMAALPDKPETLAVLESTANGRGNYFYKTWAEAMKGRGGWTPYFVSWKNAPEYRIHLEPKEKGRFRDMMTEGELKLEKDHGLDEEQLAWRRRKLDQYAGLLRPPEDVFREQFPLTPEEAFISTGRQFFDMKAVVVGEQLSKDAKFEDGWLEPVAPFLRHKPASVKFNPTRAMSGKISWLRVWKHPQVGCDYVLGADVAMGLAGGDESVAYVMRRDNQEVVAMIAGCIEPDAFADMLIDLAWYYNEAFLCPENNSIGMAVAKRTSSKYRRHAYQIDMSTPGDPKYHFDKPGWNTNSINRREMFAQLRQQVRDGQIAIWDEKFWEQCGDFIVPEDAKGRMNEAHPRAITHKHDDRIAAAAITLQAHDPLMAGPIRRPKPTMQTPRNAMEALFQEDVKSEDKPARGLVDEHTGRI